MKPTYRRINGRWLTLVAAAWFTASCASPDQPVVPGPSSSPLFALAPAASVVTEEQDVYVSLPPDSIPSGVTASISNRRTGASVTTAIVAGGFDPVAIPAVAGDSIKVAVQTTALPLSFTYAVPPAIPPVVVRTDPVPNKRDVPLNARLVIVFNQPIDATTLTGSTVQLLHGGTIVPGVVSFGDAQHVIGSFQPTVPLAANSDYQIAVGSGIRDTHGERLAAPVSVAFTTGQGTTTDTPVASIVVGPQVDLFGGGIQLTATAMDAAGNTLAGRSFVWTSSDTTLASVDSTGFVTGSRQVSGIVTIAATTGGRSGSETIRVDCSNPIPTCTASTFGIGQRTITGTISELMSDGTMQPVSNATYYAWINIPNVGGYTTGPRQSDINGAFRIDGVPDGLVSVLANPGALAQPCMAVANTVGQNAVLNVTVVDSANPLPLRTMTAPAVTGTVYQLINGVKTPAAGAVVQYNTWVPDLVVAETFTDSSGRYALCNLQFSFPRLGSVGYISAVAAGNIGSFDSWVTVTVSGPGTADIIVP